MENDQNLVEFVQVGGSIDKAKAGDYHIDIKSVFSEAWQQTKLIRVNINLALFAVFVIASLTSALVIQYLGSWQQVLEDANSLSLLQLLVTLVTAPFIAGIEMMAVLNAVGFSVKANLVLKFLNRSGFVVLASLICALLAGLGLQLLIIPGLFVLVCTSLINPLILEKRLSVNKALVLSFQAMRHQWLKLLAIFTLFFFGLLILFVPITLAPKNELFIIPMVLFIFGLSYLAPMFFIVKGILYREIFGMQLAKIPTDQIPPSDVFNA